MRTLHKYPLTMTQASIITDRYAELLSRGNNVTKSNQPYHGIISSEAVFKTLVDHAITSVKDEVVLRTKALEKWIYEQGGSFSNEKIGENIPLYTTSVRTYRSRMREIAHCIKRVFIDNGITPKYNSYIIKDSRELFNTYVRTHKSSAGWTSVDERGLFHVLVEGIRQAVGDPYHMDPIIAGMRLKDNKYRNIFIDSIANYFRETRVFKRLFEEIESLECNVAEHHYDVADEIVRLHGHAAYGGDYKGMDWHLVLPVLYFVLDIAQDLYNIPQHEVDEMKRVLEAICNAEIVVGQEIFKSVWNMLSGIYPTHDLESLLNLAIVSTAVSSCGIRVVLHPRKLKANEAYIKVCGDDIVVVFGKAHPSKEQVTARHAYYAQAVGQVLEVSKADWVTLEDNQGIFFCKRFYALSQNTSGYKQILSNNRQVPIPKYSIEKALNGLYHPEHIPSFTDKRSLVYWTQAVMDNAAGHTAFPRICYELFQSNPLFNDKTLIDFIPNQEDILTLQKKWNIRQYGILDKSISPFWTLLLKYLQNK